MAQFLNVDTFDGDSERGRVSGTLAAYDPGVTPALNRSDPPDHELPADDLPADDPPADDPPADDPPADDPPIRLAAGRSQ